MKIKAINPETGQFQEQIITLESGISGECLIGRDPRCGLVLSSPEISRIHARILFQEGHYYFADLGSTNGSQIDSQEVEINRPYTIEPHNLISIGGFVITIAEIPLNEDDSKNSSHDLQQPGELKTEFSSLGEFLTNENYINTTEDVKFSEVNDNSITPTTKSSKKEKKSSKKAKKDPSNYSNPDSQEAQASSFGNLWQSLTIRTITGLWREWLIVHMDKY